MTKVEVSGWEYGARKVDAAFALRDLVPTGLGAAKAMVDSVMEGKTVCVDFATEGGAQEFVNRARELGFHARRV